MTAQWKLADKKCAKKKQYIRQMQDKNERILTTVEKDELEKLLVYEDTWPLLACRKAFLYYYIIFYRFMYAVQEHPMFENISIFVILCNSLVMMAEDPSESNPSDFFVITDSIFLYLYTVEMLIKISGLGFVWAQNSYLRDGWNMLDFVIVLSGYIPIIIDSLNPITAGGYRHEVGVVRAGADGVDLTGLRVFRVLRPLKSI